MLCRTACLKMQRLVSTFHFFVVVIVAVLLLLLLLPLGFQKLELRNNNNKSKKCVCVCVYIFICEGFQAGDRITTPAGSIIFTRWLVSGIFILPPYSSPLWPLLVALVALFLGPSLSSSSSSSASFPLKPIQLGN